MRQLEPHITVRAIQPVVAGLEALGHDVGTILAAASIRREELEDGVLQHSLPGGRAVPRQPAEFLATVWVRLGRLVTGVFTGLFGTVLSSIRLLSCSYGRRCT